MYKDNVSVVFLVGIPGSGKSTLRDKLKMPYISTDFYIELWADQQETTYNEIFQTHYKMAQEEANKDIDFIISRNISFVWDQTNISIKSRAPKLERLPSHYKKIAYVLDVDFETALQRNRNRTRIIPTYVIENMYKSFEIPTLEEGFSEIHIFDKDGNVKEIIK